MTKLEILEVIRDITTILEYKITKLQERVKYLENSNKLYKNTDGTGYRG